MSNHTDELKVYTGKDAIKALLEGKVLLNDNYQCKIEDDKILYSSNGIEWFPSSMSLQSFLRYEFTEVAFPQVGDWVRVTCKNDGFSKVYTAEIKRIDNEGIWGEWNQPLGDIISPILLNDYSDWEILTPEQVSEYKREQAFVKVGRKLNEFRLGDIVYIQSVYRMAIVSTKNNEQFINLHSINEEGKGHTALPHQLTPIAFVEQQVDLS